MGLLNWVVGVLEVVAPVPEAQKQAVELSIAVFVGVLVVLLVFYRDRILPHSVVWIRKICARILLANAKATTLSREAIRLNDSVYQLHKPEGDPKLQVVFFHGLLFEDSEMHLSTWQSGDGSGCIWPKTWLAKDFPDAQILAISYVEGLEEGSAERFHMHNISENLINDFMQAGIGQQPYCPVLLVGHSFGGLVIKELCLEAHNSSIGHNGGSSIKKFLENLRGIFYYSTPHRGSPHIDKAEKHLKGPLFKYFKSLSIDAAVLNYRFNNLPTAFHQNLQVEGLGEGRKVQSGLFKGCVVVPEASARDGDKFNLESTADHFSICRPKDKTSRRFKYLTTLLQNIDEKMKQEKKIGDEIREKEEAKAIRRALQEDLLNRLVEGTGYKLHKLTKLVDSVHSQVMEKVRESDFEGALACWDVLDTDACSSPHKLFFLQEKGVLMRLAGDLHGALKCLTAALETYGNPEANCDDEVDYSGYNCWKHRGYVNFLLGDLDRAQKDGGMALRVLHCQHKARQYLNFLHRRSSDQPKMPSNLAEEPVNYMHFRLGGRTDPRHSERLYSSREKLKEKLSVSDFSGALAIWDAVDVDGKVSSLSGWFIFLLQRGTLKRLAGDLHGALGDLTMALTIALETIRSGLDGFPTTFKSLNLPDSFLYECLKQRGFVNYLLGDWDGARENGTMALKDPKLNPVYSEGEDGDKHTYNCWKNAGYVKYLLEALDGANDDGAIALGNGTDPARARTESSRQKDEFVRYLATEAGCEYIGARGLDIISGDDDRCWKWATTNGRFRQIVKLQRVRLLEVKGRWLGHLSPGSYTLSWRFRLTDDVSWDQCHVQFSFQASGNAGCTTECSLSVQNAMASIESSDEQQQALRYTWDGPDGWMELAVGEFTIENDDLPVEIEFSMKETNTGWCKAQLFLHCVMICPSSTVQNRREQLAQLPAARPALRPPQSIQSSLLHVKEMVRVSDYRRALAIWERVDSRRLPPRRPPGANQAFFLQERGILKRYLDDLHGALEDLTAALKINKKKDYECLKHRAYVKYLLKDLDGARMDAKRCLAMGVKEPNNSHHACLGERSVAFLEFEL